jgi:pimeloyl-ACP methyl ester carboxylesterase
VTIHPDPLDATTRDGRRLGGYGFGPATGTPVLFIAGAATGRSMIFGQRYLQEHNVRLISMDRPGMAASTADPARTLHSTAEDYATFLSAVAPGSGTARIVANSQGAVFGLALASRHPVRKLVLVSPVDEVASPEVAARLPRPARELAELVGTDPGRAGRWLSALDPASMEAMVLEGADPEDRAVYSDPAFLARYRTALVEGFSNGAAGYVRDTLIAMSPWDIEWNSVTGPVDVYFGKRDHVHSPDHGALLATRIPRATRHLVPDAGAALLWTHADLVLRAALQG